MAVRSRQPLPAPVTAQVAAHALFAGLDQPTLAVLLPELELIELPAGAALFAEGDPGDALYLVVSGRLRVARAAPGGEHAVREIGRGELVGEFALLTGEPRSATVRAVRDSNLVRLSQALFERLLQRYPQAMTQIARSIVQRVRGLERGAPAGAAASVFAILPAGDVPLATFAHDLAEALAAFGPTLHLSSAQCEQLFGEPGIAQIDDDHPRNSALVGWLSEQETHYRQIVYLADHTWTPWTRRCLRQADRLLLVGQAAADPAPTRLELAARAAGVQARAELVLLHPAGARAAGNTQAWLTPRGTQAHHHVRLGSSDDLARLVRRLTGRAIGVVLGGGGARGTAHIGALRALDEAGLRADFIGGTSIGALIGALYASGHSHAELAALAAEFSSRRKLLDFTLPFTAFNATRKLTAVYRELFGELRIEDLWRRFFCISSNLTRAEPVVHEHGPLWAAVRASTAIPVIFAPLLHTNGDVLVDGGILNNFPIDVMRTHCEAGLVIGIDVAPPTDKVRDYQFGPSVSGWQQLWARLSPFGRKARAPLLFESLVRTIEINSAHRVRSPAFRRFADLLIQMPDRQFGRLAFDIYPEMIEMGYRETVRQIAEWRRSPPVR
ncbi:MAG: patatin-like phospholipase family protein [Kouleothrix sp.]|jgi:predicted acylesterase/phospholipase RssA|nr:patatin-like phospholipase family protein [Kouleothrix sp.]